MCYKNGFPKIAVVVVVTKKRRLSVHPSLRAEVGVRLAVPWVRALAERKGTASRTPTSPPTECRVLAPIETAR